MRTRRKPSCGPTSARDVPSCWNMPTRCRLSSPIPAKTKRVRGRIRRRIESCSPEVVLPPPVCRPQPPPEDPRSPVEPTYQRKEGPIMLSILGRGTKLCDGITRRELLRVGGLAFAGLTLADVLRLRAQAAPDAG